MCKVIAVSNQKGGVGKTVSCVNLGIGLAQEGKKVLLIDGDPQGSLTISLGYEEPDEMEYSLATLMMNIVNDEKLNIEKTIHHHKEGVDLIPANIELSAIEVSLVNAMSRELILKSMVEKLRDFYDFIIIDCMPSLGMMTINALACADSVLIPVLDDEKMDTLVDSIRENGILNPVIVRPDNSGDYEMISGHRRLHAAGIAGLKKVPAIVKEMSDDEAIIIMVDANVQREEILPSERAFSLKMKMDAMRRQGARLDVNGTCGTECHKLGTKTSEIVGESFGLKGRQVRKYIRLTELIPDMLVSVDNKKITITMGVDLSYLDEQIQKWVYEYYKDNGFLKPVQVEAVKNYPNLANATQQSVISIMNDALPKKSVSAKITFSEKKLDKYFPSHFSSKDRENTIIQLLEKWSVEQGQTI